MLCFNTMKISEVLNVEIKAFSQSQSLEAREDARTEEGVTLEETPCTWNFREFHIIPWTSIWTSREIILWTFTELLEKLFILLFIVCASSNNHKHYSKLINYLIL